MLPDVPPAARDLANMPPPGGAEDTCPRPTATGPFGLFAQYPAALFVDEALHHGIHLASKHKDGLACRIAR
ncbi:hypothetical protein [Burkholderia oklahomensis]|uniref:hypothetical protein n=1 Tax=Burkholderia oklahomensis TaxID=342113 RepID=UPI0002FFA248|nr:hypothetical protein [Burkholderia oklahomensis]MBI0362494.1 hypothetical protein [Burkholderia oklahomensis]QPS40063.1 hypothetical protein I6G57_30295 [Burkholderia oklahomensis]